MNTILDNAEDVLRQHPAPAMTLGQLHRRLHEQWPMLTPARPNLRRVLETEADRFLVLDPCLGPWSHAKRGSAPLEELDNVLVLGLGSGLARGTRLPADARLRESVRWIARGLDRRSRRSLARLYLLLLSDGSVRTELQRQAA